MPGRIIPNFVRPSVSLHPSSTSSSSSSVNEYPHQMPHSHRKPEHLHPERTHSPDRRLHFAVEQLIHPHRDHSKEKRRSLGRSSRSKERAAKEDATPTSAKLDVIVESPPLICYGTPANSTGALFSGRLRVSVSESVGAGVTLNSFDMRLVSKTSSKKPVSRDCQNCTTRTDQLTNWNFLTEPLHLKPGDHDFPFSYLFPGNTPASCNGTLGRIEYLLLAQAQSASGEIFTYQMPLNIRRAILPGNDKSSIRIFPPTNLTGRIVLPSVVHPIGTFPVQMTLSGVVDKGEETQTRWRLRKMIWRIEEHQKNVSKPCAKHAHKVGEGKGILHQETRVIGHDEEKGGWKTDFDTAGGEIGMEFDASINPTCNPVCNLESAGGLEVKHSLVIELVVAEEFCPNRNTRLITPTGAARVLRMQFSLLVTERSGLGISWDEEMPPMYEDVPASPPGYTVLDDNNSTMEDYHGSPLALPHADEDLDQMDSLRLDSGSGRSSLQSTRGRTRLTVDDLTAGPPETGSSHRAESVDSRTNE